MLLTSDHQPHAMMVAWPAVFYLYNLIRLRLPQRCHSDPSKGHIIRQTRLITLRYSESCSV